MVTEDVKMGSLVSLGYMETKKLKVEHKIRVPMYTVSTSKQCIHLPTVPPKDMSSRLVDP